MIDQSLAPAKEHERLLSLDEFVQRYETEGPFEFIDGEFIPVSPVVAGHGNRARTLSTEDTLTAPDILPGFALPIRTLFAG